MSLLSFPKIQVDRTTLQLVVGGASALLAGVALRQYLASRFQPKHCAVISRPGLLGALPEIWKAFNRHDAHSKLADFHDQEGDTLFLHFGVLAYFEKPLVFTRDPRNVEYMLKTKFDNFVKGDNFRSVMHELLGDGIFNVDGDLWFKQRKTASQMFTANQFKNHIWQVVEKNCDKVLKILADSTEVDMFNLLNRFTLDSIGEIGFGTSIGSLENPVSPFLQSFDEAQRIVFKRFVLPFWRVLQFFGLGPERESRHHMKKLRAYSADIVKELATSLDTSAGDSFVGLFMKKEPNLSDEFLADLVLNFLIAGRDTTAQAMSWCLYNIMQHPEVEVKILEELEAVCHGNPLQYDQLGQLTYLDAVLREALRLHPSVPLDAKFTQAADTLPDGTYVPRGAMVMYNSYSMGRSQAIWGPDASSFKPERWLNGKPRSPYENPVFHGGPRECLGKRLAMVEMKTVVAALVRFAKLRLSVPPESVKPDTAATLGMSSGLRCTVELRGR
mmetsp:Transcript_60048/g.140369  ORF Transcript_60048/g.140369 Transcript_60048/m.140369 type:complete len:500 (+) Transcript_60048:60-1559(+)